MSNPRYEIRKDSGNQYFFNLKAGNGERVLTSEKYTTKTGCQNGIASCRTNCPIDSRYNRRSATNGQAYFTLHAANGEVIGVSETYSSTWERDRGIDVVKRDGTTTNVVDLS